jgi:hypothetical protein
MDSGWQWNVPDYGSSKTGGKIAGDYSEVMEEEANLSSSY